MGIETVTFKTDPHPETYGVDGRAQHAMGACGSPGMTWAQMQGGAGTGAADHADSYFVGFRAFGTYCSPPVTYYDEGFWWYMNRLIFVWDCSAHARQIVLSGTVRLRLGADITDDFGSAKLALYSADPASDTEVLAGDYDSLDTIAYTDIINLSSLTPSDWNTWTLNSTGIAAINTALAGDGKVRLGMREANYDAANNEPTWEAVAQVQVEVLQAESGTSTAPQLVLTMKTRPGLPQII